jgi:hypothetical protein
MHVLLNVLLNVLLGLMLEFYAEDGYAIATLELWRHAAPRCVCR